MWSTTTARRVRMVVICAAVVLGVSMAAHAQQMTYEGDIVAVDGHADTFTVRSSKPGEAMEMVFHVGAHSEVMIHGNEGLFGELVKGDHVVVSYGTAGTTHTAGRAERVGTTLHEMTFTGSVIAIDTKAHTVIARTMNEGRVEEKGFHLNPATKLYIDGQEDRLLSQLQMGDVVTVAYESTDPTTHNAKHVSKS